ncbi:hypothetical protein LINPERPRIM_LOCUS36255 [Linum perenne]
MSTGETRDLKPYTTIYLDNFDHRLATHADDLRSTRRRCLGQEIHAPGHPSDRRFSPHSGDLALKAVRNPQTIHRCREDPAVPDSRLRRASVHDPRPRALSSFRSSSGKGPSEACLKRTPHAAASSVHNYP